MPVPLYRLSSRLHRAGRVRTAKALELLVRLLFGAILPAAVEAGPNFRLGHRGFGIVIHPKTRIGADVFLHHNVTLAADLADDDPRDQVIGSRVSIGTGAVVLGPITVGDDVVIAAGAVVTKDVPDGCVMGGVPAVVLNTDGAAKQRTGF